MPGLSKVLAPFRHASNVKNEKNTDAVAKASGKAGNLAGRHEVFHKQKIAEKFDTKFVKFGSSMSAWQDQLNELLTQFYAKHKKYRKEDSKPLGEYLRFAQDSDKVELVVDMGGEGVYEELMKAVSAAKYDERSGLHKILTVAWNKYPRLPDGTLVKQQENDLTRFDKPNDSVSAPEGGANLCEESSGKGEVVNGSNSGNASNTPLTQRDENEVVNKEGGTNPFEQDIQSAAQRDENKASSHFHAGGSPLNPFEGDVEETDSSTYASMSSLNTGSADQAGVVALTLNTLQPESTGVTVSVESLDKFVSALNDYYINSAQKNGVPGKYSNHRAAKIKKSFDKHPEVSEVFKLVDMDGAGKYKVELKGDAVLTLEAVQKALQCLHKGHENGGGYEGAFNKANVPFLGLEVNVDGGDGKGTLGAVEDRVVPTQQNQSVITNAEGSTNPFEEWLDVEAPSDPSAEVTSTNPLVKSAGVIVSVESLHKFVSVLNDYYLNAKQKDGASGRYDKNREGKIKAAFDKYSEIRDVFEWVAIKGSNEYKVVLKENATLSHEAVQKALDCLYQGHDSKGGYVRAFANASIPFRMLGLDVYGGSEKAVRKAVDGRYGFMQRFTQGREVVQEKNDEFYAILDGLKKDEYGKQPTLNKEYFGRLIDHYQHLEKLDGSVRKDLNEITNDLVPQLGFNSAFQKILNFVGVRRTPEQVQGALEHFESDVGVLEDGVREKIMEILKKLGGDHSAEKTGERVISVVDGFLGELYKRESKKQRDHDRGFDQKLSDENRNVVRAVAVDNHAAAAEELVNKYFGAFEVALDKGVQGLTIDQIAPNAQPEELLPHIGKFHAVMNKVFDELGKKFEALDTEKQVDSTVIAARLDKLKDTIRGQIDQQLDMAYQTAVDHWLKKIDKAANAELMTDRIHKLAKLAPGLTRNVEDLKKSGKLTEAQLTHLSSLTGRLESVVKTLKKPGMFETTFSGIQSMLKTPKGIVASVGAALTAGGVAALVGTFSIGVGVAVLPIAGLAWLGWGAAQGWSKRQAAEADLLKINDCSLILGNMEEPAN
ncbi:hypothetical protein [Pseudomonas sp. MWU13-3659]|uniref:hypothetical protein n=1 Tax=Pseudomonas sp. MWU13-3659 TaxID=2986964 RepID=UPI002075933C|nr:hypothetical protein [Pseudomonas sp. MWU13-3659]